MAGNSLQLTWDLIARDGASPAFEKVAASADKAAASTETAAAKTSTAFSTMAKVGAVAGVAFAAEAVKMASEFQRQMTLVQTQAGASAQEVRNMTPAILSLSGKVAQAPEALATSLYHVESTGLRGKAALDAVKVAAEGAAVGHADLEETTNALTATLASGMVPATESFSQAMGQLNTIVGSGDMKLSDLNAALGTGFMVQVKQYGATLNDVGAALADFGDNNIRGADAATMVRMAVQAIAVPGVNAAAALGQIGLTVQQLQSDEQTGGLNKALIDLHSHLVSSGIDATQWGALMTEAFTKKAGGGITTLIGTFDRFEQKYKEVSAGAGSFGSAWEATTKTAAFQAAALRDNIEAMTTSVGTHLLPVVTTTMTWINNTGVPALQHLGSGAMDVAHWFGELPAPIRDTALALGALALANAIGLTGALATGVSRVGSAFSGAGGIVQGFGDEMALQSRLAAMEATSLSEVDRALGAVSGSAARAARSLTAAQVSMTSGKFAGWDLALSQVVVEEDAVATGAGRMSAAVGAAATRGASAMQGFIGALGGGTGIAIGATLIMLPELAQGFEILTGHVIDTTSATQSFTTALEATNGVIDSNVRKTAQQQLEQANVAGVFQKAGISAKDAIDGITGNAAAQDRVNKALQDYIDHAPDGQGAHSKLATAAAQARGAYSQLAGAFGTSAAQAKYFGDSTGAAADSMGKASQAAKDAAPALEYAGSAADMSADEVKNANKEWETWIKNLSGLAGAFADPLTTYENLLSQKQAAEQKAAQATADATKSGKDSWKDYTQNVSVSLSEYAKSLEDQLKNEADWQKNLVTIAQRGGVEVAQQFADMGEKGASITAQMANATNSDFTRMAQDMIHEAQVGGQDSAKSLDQDMRVMAQIGLDGAQATAINIGRELNIGAGDVLAIAQKYGANLATGINPVLGALGQHPIILNTLLQHPMWTGGYTGDGGKFEPKGVVHGGEFVFTKEQTSAAGVDNLYALAQQLSGYSGGGFVSPSDVPRPYSTAPFQVPLSTAAQAAMQKEYDTATSWLSQNTFTGTGTGAGSPFIRALGMAIAATMGFGSQFNAIDYIFSHESGWNPLAQNPTSTAFGIPQFLNSTWAEYGGKTTDPATQIRDGIRYMVNRYGSPNNAAAFWQAHHWYKNGTNYVPTDQLAVLHKGEAVIPASANQGAPYTGGTTVVGAQYNGQVIITDSDRREALHYRYASAAYARFR